MHSAEDVRPFQQVLSPLFTQLQNTQGKWAGQCVRYVNKVLGTNIPGSAWDWKSTSNYPVIGGVVLFRRHVAVVVGIIGDNLVVAESNYNYDERIDIGRTVPINSPSIRGYIIPPTVAVQ